MMHNIDTNVLSSEMVRFMQRTRRRGHGKAFDGEDGHRTRSQRFHERWITVTEDAVEDDQGLEDDLRVQEGE